MSKTRRITLLLTLLLLAMELLTVSFYRYNPGSMPAGGIVLDDVDLGYKLFVPGGWYGVVPPVKSSEMNQMFFDLGNWYQRDEIQFPLDVYQLKKYENVRLFFTRLAPDRSYAQFSPLGYVIVMQDKTLPAMENFKGALRWAGWEWVNTWSVREDKLALGIHKLDGTAWTNTGKPIWVSAAYFERDIGLIVIPVATPMTQEMEPGAAAQTYLDEIVASIMLY